MALRQGGGAPPVREIDLADLLLDVADILEYPDLDAYIFGSRRFGTGSVRSDVDVLISGPSLITRAQAEQIWAREPYLDIFHGGGGEVRSLVNESAIVKESRAALLATLDAVPLYERGTWQPSGDPFRIQRVLAEREPMATMADLYELGQAQPGARADILVMTALAEEFLAVIAVLRATREGDRARATLTDRGGSPWRIEIVLINNMGSVHAALETQDALRRTKAPHVALLGLAAGFPGDVELEDVVVPEQVVYYEGQKITASGSDSAPSWRPTNPKVRRTASITPVLAGLAAGKSARVHTDIVMACGEKVVASGDFREALGPNHRKLACLDMESFGVACAAERRHASFSVIKGISDYADDEKHDGHRDAAAKNAACEFRLLVEEKAFAFDPDD